MSGQDVPFTVSRPWLAHWLVVLRLVAGRWLLHAGLDKLANWPFDASWCVGGAAAATSLGPLVTTFGSGARLTSTSVAASVGQLPTRPGPGPGLGPGPGPGPGLGALTRAAAFFGAFTMVFFYFINGETGGWAHGVVTGELLGLLTFGMIAAVGARCVLGVDAHLARTEFVASHPRLRYLIG